jgi:hypothetical protein
MDRLERTNVVRISKQTQAYLYRPEGKSDLTYPETTDVFALINNEIMPLQRRCAAKDEYYKEN